MKKKIVVVIPAYNEEKTIKRTLRAIEAQDHLPDEIVVVDNNSSDKTANLIKNNFPAVHLVTEKKKGTGVACNTGFRYAIDKLGADIVMRTDADTVPDKRWIEAVKNYFARHKDVKILTGPSLPLKDEYYKYYDELLKPAAHKIYGVMTFVKTGSRIDFRMAIGHNLAIRSEFYDAVGGFPKTRIEHVDEDMELTRKIYNTYGYKSLGRSRNMVVRTSMRRIRTTGYFKLLKYYPTDANKRQLEAVRKKLSGGDVDIR